MVIQKELKKWSKDTVASYLTQVNSIGENLATSFYNQSDLSRVKDCELMIIGINPGCGCIFSEWKLKDRITEDFLYYGNPCFRKKDGSIMSDEEIISNYYEKYDSQKRKYGWDLMKKIHKMLDYSGKGEIVKQLDKFVFTNMVFFGTYKEGQIPKGINQEECAKQTIALIDILRPKLILLLGVKCKNLFEKTLNIKMKEIEASNLSYFRLKGSYVFAIRHTARFYSNVECEEISKTICYALDFPDKFEEKFRLIQLKHKIGSHDSIQWINAQGTLIHEYWCMGKDGCKKENGTISVGLKINDNKQYVLSVFSKGNHPDKFERMICDYCNKSDLLISDRDLSYLIDISTDDESIVEFINILLQKMKEYRETDFPV